MMHISNTEMHLIEQSKLQNKTIMNSKSYYINNPQDIAGSFNQNVCNIGPELEKTINPPTSASSNFSHSCTSTFSFVDTSVEEVICGIDYLKIGKP